MKFLTMNPFFGVLSSLEIASLYNFVPKIFPLLKSATDPAIPRLGIISLSGPFSKS